MQQKIIVTGAGGQLGRELQQWAASIPQFEFVFATREQLDISDAVNADTFFATHQAQYCINCAAYTAVDRAESEKEAAYRINAEGPELLARLSKKYDFRLIHVSTDYVFDGTGRVPYTEEFATNPVSIYGASKLEGEENMMSAQPDGIIVRTSWVYSEFGNNFVKTMLRLMKERKELGVVNDQFGSPTYAKDLAEVILQIITSGKWMPGIYHYCNAGMITWYDFAVAIKELGKFNCTVNAILTSAYPTAAVRPAYSVLDTSKLSGAYAVVPKPWKQSLEACLQKLLVTG